MAPIAISSSTIEVSHIKSIKSSLHGDTSSLLHHAGPKPRAVSANELTLKLEDGRVLLDGCGGAAVACLGMGNQEIIDAMTAQASKMSYAYHQLVDNPPAEELGAWLCDRSEGAFVCAAFLNSGEIDE